MRLSSEVVSKENSETMYCDKQPSEVFHFYYEFIFWPTRMSGNIFVQGPGKYLFGTLTYLHRGAFSIALPPSSTRRERGCVLTYIVLYDKYANTSISSTDFYFDVKDPCDRDPTSGPRIVRQVRIWSLSRIPPRPERHFEKEISQNDLPAVSTDSVRSKHVSHLRFWVWSI